MATEETNKARGAAQELPAEEPQIKNEAKARKLMMWATIIVSVIVVGVIVYIYGFRNPDITNGNQAIGQADKVLIFQGNDSIALDQYKAVAANYGHHAGNRAKLNAAILLYNDGDYQQALSYLKDYDATDAIIGAAAASLKGDCYDNLDNLDDAVKSFKSAISISDENPAYTPFFMMKLATVYSAQGNYKDAAELYRQIDKNYPLYGPQSNIDIEKYLDYAEAMAAKGAK